jgi:3-mercaptopyruvate sulfurtransferase SseA
MRVFLLVLVVFLSALAALGQDAPKPGSTEAPRISLEEAKQSYDKKTAIFVDARGRETYKQEHIKGAINLPLGEEPDLKVLPTDKTIIVYCS